MMNKNNKISASFTILTLSFGLLFIYTTTIQGTQILTPVDAATTQHKDNPTQGAKYPANQTGEKMQSGAANATQGAKYPQTKQEKLGNLLRTRQENLSNQL